MVKKITAYQTPSGNQYDTEEEAHFEMALEVIDEKAQVANAGRVIRGLLNQGLLKDLKSAIITYEIWAKRMKRTELKYEETDNG